jgi:hypothetical protein
MRGHTKMTVRAEGDMHEIRTFVRTRKQNHIDLILSADLQPGNKEINQWIEMNADEAEDLANRLLREAKHARGETQ